MLKLVFMTDTHGKATNPISRLDDFPQALLNKLAYVGQFAEGINADAVIHGGDWVETPDVSEGYISKMVQTIIENFKCPIYSVIGNHDIYGYNPATFARTPLAIANASGIFERLYRERGRIIEGKNEVVNLTGQDAIYDLDKGTDFYYCESDILGRYNNKKVTNIHVVHGLLGKDLWPVPCTLIKEISNKVCAQIILSGHDHVGYGIVKENERIFCNPGSLARTTAAIGDVRRDVRIAVITVDGGDYDIELHTLPLYVAKSSNEVIDRKKLEDFKRAKEQMDSFITSLNDQKINLGSNVYEALDKLAKDLNISDEVLKKAKEELEIAEEVLSKNE